MFKKKIYLLIVLNLFVFFSYSQDIDYVKKQISILSSKQFWGRGYVNNGVNKAAKYLAKEMQNIGLSSFNNSYFQKLNYSVNTFPGNITFEIDGIKLKNGSDFFIGSSCPKLNNEYEIVSFDSITLVDTVRFLAQALPLNLKNKIVVIDFSFLKQSNVRWFYIYLMKYNYINAGGYIELSPDNLSWAVRGSQQNIPIIKVRKSSWINCAKKAKIKVKPKLIKNYNTENVVGYLKGTSDEYIIICGHYDHLGCLGNGIFTPGANDNASGTSMVLDLAKYYSKNKPKYNIIFACFTGEEAGLYGSNWFVNNPPIELNKIKIVINLDMVGTGEDGTTMVNGAAEGYEKIADKFKEINERKKCFETFNMRGEAKNSDHYPFHEKGVKAVFFYTMGAETYYHSPKDVIDNLSFSGYLPLFNLITNFIEEYE